MDIHDRLVKNNVRSLSSEVLTMARPREFDTDEALAAITDVFWNKGYDGASMQDLVAATGLKKGSLYAAFGDKRRMYHAALARYDQQQISAAVALMREPGSGPTRLKRLFRTVLNGARVDGDARGCFLCNAATDQATTDAAAAEALRKSTGRLETAIVEALADTPYGRRQTARRGKARELLGLYFGLRVMAKMGLPSAALEEAVGAAMAELA
ncbi:MAG: TetR/AcrR family transcriptional regulator [Methyloligellaceae bacterium]